MLKNFKVLFLFCLGMMIGCSRSDKVSIATDSGTTESGMYSTGVKLRGINIAGAEYGDDWDGWNGQTYFTWRTTAALASEMKYFGDKGMNCFRLPISWERLQHTLYGPLDQTYKNELVRVVNQATSAGWTVIVDLHNYNRYAIGAFEGSTQSKSFTVQKMGDGKLTSDHLSDVWIKLANLFVSNNKVIFNIMNESHDFPMTSTVWFAEVQKVMNSIRSTGAKQLLLVPNSRSSDVTHWSTWSPNGGPLDSVAALAITDKENNYAFDMHAYDNAVEATSYSRMMVDVTNWAKANKKKLFLSELGVPETSAVGAESIKGLMNYLNANSDVWMGWTAWNLPPHNLWKGNYTTDGPAMAWYSPFLVPDTINKKATEPTPVPVVSPTKPTAPIAYTPSTAFTVTDSGITSYVNVPVWYKNDHNTPMTLFVWLHGCGGMAKYDIDMISPTNTVRSWISLAVGGREGTCWSSTATDGAKILSAIAGIKTHFNIDPSKVILGGYSSGGDVGYPLLFQNANLFAGAIFENTGPNSTAMTSSLKSAWKMPIVHIAHTSDGTYPIATVKANMAKLTAAGFPVTFIEKPGTHWDNDTATSGTKYDLATFGFPYLSAGWSTPSAGSDAGVVDAGTAIIDAGVVDAAAVVKDSGVDAGVVSSSPKFYSRTEVYNKGVGWQCAYLIVTNNTPTTQSWSTIYVNMQGATKLGDYWFVSSATPKNTNVSGSVKFKPIDRPTLTASEQKKNVGGFCYSIEDGKVAPTVSGID